MSTTCEIDETSICCSIITELPNCEFAFYFDINGERRENSWYSDNPSATYVFGDETVYFVLVTFFVREADGTIHYESVKKRTHWSYCDGILSAVELLTDENSTILEFGSGYGSNEIGKTRKIFSVEHDDRFVDIFPNVDYIYAPLKRKTILGSNVEADWYDTEAVISSLPEKTDLILVDGPPAKVGRMGIISVLDNFSDNAVWIIDDVLRTEDQKLANGICMKNSLIQYRFWNFSILSRRPIHSEIIQQIHEVSLQVLSNTSKSYLSTYYP